MKFAPASIGSMSFSVLLVSADWSQKGIQITHKLDTGIDLGRTTIEERYPLRSSWLLTQKCNLQAYQGEADDWRKGLAALGNNRIGMPIWVDAMPTSAWSTRIYDPQQVINWDPVSDSFEIIAQGSMPSDPTTLPYPMIAPLMIGYWTKRPPADAITNALGNIAIELKEASPYTCRVGLISVGSGWTQNPDWTSSPQDQSDFGLELLLAQNSTAREPALDGINSAARWMQTAGFTFMDRTEIGTALTWFVTQGGCWQSWSGLPAWLQPGTATTGTPNTYTARFLNDSLVLDYDTPNLATSRIGFIQEIQVTGRSQAVPAQAFLFQVTYLADPTNPDLYCNWDAPLTVGSSVFNPAQVDIKMIRTSLRPQDDQSQVVFPYEAGSIIDDWTKGRLYKPVTVSIYLVNPNSLPGSLPNPMQVGYITKVEPNGTNLTVTSSLFGQMLARRVTTYGYGNLCNAHVFDVKCGLTESSYDSSGTLLPSYLSADGLSLHIPAGVITGWMGSNTSYPDDWFGKGTLRTGSGRLTVIALIQQTDMDGSGNMTIFLSRPMFADMIASGGQSMQLVPGCDGQYVSTCGAKFNNQGQFRATPFIPNQLQQLSPASPLTPKK